MRLTLAGHAGSPDVDLDLADDVRLGDLRRELAAASGRGELAGTAGRAPVVLAVDDAVLGDDHLTGHPPLVAGAVLRAGPGAPDVDRAALGARWHLAVVGGPDAGALVPLDGVVLVGRAPGPGAGHPSSSRPLVVDDPTVSARQVEVRPGRRAPRARDLGSRNGTRLVRRRGAGRPVALRRGARRLASGDRLVLGATVLEARSATAEDEPAGRRGARAPRRPPAGTPTSGWAAPAVGALVLAAATGNRMLLALAVIAPATALGGVAAGRCLDLVRARRGPRHPAGARGAVDDAVDGLGGAPERLPVAADLRTSLLRAAWPPRTVAGPGPAAEAVGTAPRATGRGGAAATSPLRSLAPDGCLTVSGPRRAALGVARLLACAEAHHPAPGVTAADAGRGPRDLPAVPASRGVDVLPHPGDPDGWRWARWIAGDPGRPAALLVVDGMDEVGEVDGRGADGRGADGRAAAVARVRASGDVPVLVVLPEGAPVPAWCGTVLTLADDGCTARLTRAGAPALSVPVTGVSAAWAERQARLLCGRQPSPGADPVGGSGADDAPAAAAPPAGVALADLPGIPRPDPDEIRRAWAATSSAEPARGLPAVVGRGPGGVPVVVDLVRDGPHGLVAGTTGAGKSELLQAWVLSLALTRSPAELALLLVDYKGGAGFGRCARLPHVTALVTDLDDALAARALTGLRAELRRRERLLAAWAVPDLATLRSHAPAQTPPRLLVVVDEFRALVDDVPAFVPGLLRVAAQGRSLGVHLLLATQRPGGAVGPDLRANLAVRVALRVTDAAESLDVLDVPDAAAIPAHAVGRAVLRRGPGAPEPLQVAHAPAPPARHRAAVRRVDGRDRDGVPAAWRGRPGDGTPGPTWARARTADGRRTGEVADAGTPAHADGLVASWVDAARAAARAAGLPRPEPPWLPPLPAHLDLRDVREVCGEPAAPGGPRRSPPPVTGGAGAPVRDGPLALGLADHPEGRRQTVVGWHPWTGPLLVVGTALTGRTTVLRTLAAGALDHGWHVHVVSAGPVPDPAPAHPGLGTVIGPDDPRRVARLLTLLAGAGSPHPQLLLVDGLEAVLDELGGVARGRGPDVLLGLVRDGRRHGVALAATASAGVPQSLLRLFGDRLVLRLGDPLADSLVGVPAALVGASRPPGRGVWLPGTAPDALDGSTGPALCQVAGVPGDGPVPEAGRTAPTPDTGSPAPVRLAAVPGHVTPEDLDRVAAVTGRRAVAPGLPVGLGGDDGGAVRLHARGGALVVGPEGSGRSTALAAVARAALRSGALLAVVARDGPLRELGDAVAPARTCGHAPAAVARLLDDVVRASAGAPAVVLVDDLDALEVVAPDAAIRLAGLVTGLGAERDEPHGAGAGPGAVRGPVLVASARTSAATTAFRGPLGALRALRCGLVLSPGEAGSAEVFGVDLLWASDPARPHAPGRGVVVRGREVTPVQVARARPVAGRGW